MRPKYLLIVALFLSTLTLFGQELTSGLLERAEVPEKYKWNTSDIYKNSKEWNADFNWIEQNLNQYDKYRGKLNQSSQNLLECLQLDEMIGRKLDFLHLYAKLHHDVDMNNEEYQQMWAKCSNLETQVSIASSFIKTEIIYLPALRIEEYIAEKPDLIVYKHFFDVLNKRSNHTLSVEDEENLFRISQVVDNHYNVYSSLVYSELDFPIIKDNEGNEIQLNRSSSWRARSSENRNYRKTGYQEYYKSLFDYKTTLTNNLNGFIAGKVYLAEARNYENSLDASLDRYNIPVEVYHNLIRSINANLQPIHRWMKIKKEVLDLDTLFLYDTRVTMFQGIQKEYSWEEAYDLTLKSLNVLGEEYLVDIKNAYAKRWIDVYPNVGKETGGYSSGPSGPHPYVKMNWGGQLLDFYTLVHELGHYVHASKTMKEQAYIYEDYPPMLAEVASTTAENISQNYLISNSGSKDEKLYHIEQYIDNVMMMIYTSTLMAEFELEMYQKLEHGESISATIYNELYKTLLIKYYGESVTVNDIDSYAWMEYPHFYLDYYLYSYATSFAASIQISSDILTKGEAGFLRFEHFLKAGISDYPVEIIKKAGVDLLSAEPYNAVAEKLNELMDEMEKLISN